MIPCLYTLHCLPTSPVPNTSFTPYVPPTSHSYTHGNGVQNHLLGL